MTDGALLVLRRPISVLYFLRNRSRRTTSPPPAGLCGPSSDGGSVAGLAVCGTATIAGVVRACFGSAAGSALGGAAGTVATGVAVASAAAGSASDSNFKPNGTDGSTNSLIDANVTA